MVSKDIVLELSEQDLMNPAVIKIMKYFDDRLSKLRIDNDSVKADENIRGNIAEIKEFKKAVNPKQRTQTTGRRSAMAT